MIHLPRVCSMSSFDLEFKERSSLNHVSSGHRARTPVDLFKPWLLSRTSISSYLTPGSYARLTAAMSVREDTVSRYDSESSASLLGGSPSGGSSTAPA